jgi:5-methylcytosine-specific restriction protein A
LAGCDQGRVQRGAGLKALDQRSGAAQAYRRWYYTPQWRALRRDQLARNPFCSMCRAMGRSTRATIADHKRPHRGDKALFFDARNLDSLCAPHHDATKQRHERGRLTVAVGEDGWPSSPRG